MAEEEIARLTAAVNRFAIQKGWVPNSHDEMVWETWKAFSTGQGHRVSTASSSRCSDEMLPVWEQCSTILNGLLRNGNAYLFSRPVDPKRDGVPNYFEVIKKPMDLGTVKQKLALNARRRHEPLEAAMYKCPSEFKADVDLIWENCFLYNPPGYEAHDMGAALKTEFERRWKALRIEESIRKIHRKVRYLDSSECSIRYVYGMAFLSVASQRWIGARGIVESIIACVDRKRVQEAETWDARSRHRLWKRENERSVVCSKFVA